MSNKLPEIVVTSMAERTWRMHHYLWHEVRNGWLFFDDATRQQIRQLGWEPPRPARRQGAQRAEPILDNDSGEDFLYMHRQMISTVNEMLAGNIEYPRVSGWNAVPRPGDAQFPVPPAWDTGDADLNSYLTGVKSDERFNELFLPWETAYTSPDQLRRMTLGELGSRIEFTIHNQMHMRWCANPEGTGMRPDVDPATPEVIDKKWDDKAYDWLGDTYSSHVNATFWKVHGWVDDRINGWAMANGIQGDIAWKGTWLGKPMHTPDPGSFLSLMTKRQRAVPLGHGHGHGSLEEMEHLAGALANTGIFCRLYDRLDVPPLP